MRIEIGGVGYDLRMVRRDIMHPGDGQQCNGLTWPDRSLIEVDARLPRDVRRKTCWHEIGHAFKCELDVHEAEQLGEEAFCNLISLALCAMSPRLYLRIAIYAARLVECDDVAFFPGMDQPMPVYRTSDEPPGVQRPS